MTVIEEIGTGVVFGLAAIAVLSFVAIAAATILVTCAVRLEERYNTLSGPPPTWFCALARRLMAVPDLSLRAGFEPEAVSWPTIADEWPAVAADRLPSADPALTVPRTVPGDAMIPMAAQLRSAGGGRAGL